MEQMEGNIISNKEKKRERFVRNVERRVNRILDNLDSLAKCSDRKNYQYTEEDIKKIFRIIETKIRDIKSFYQASNGQKKRFKL